jgi:hypothetical protein
MDVENNPSGSVDRSLARPTSESASPATQDLPPAPVSGSSGKTSIKDSPWIVYTTMLVTLLSFALNAYLLYDKLNQRSIEQPPPILSRIQMTILKSAVVDAVAAKQSTLLSLFPNLEIVVTDLWKQQLKAAEPLPPGEKEARRFRFLVVRNPSPTLTYKNIRLTNGSNGIAVVDTLPPASSRLVLLDSASQDSRIDARYRIAGSSKDHSEVLLPTVGNEVVMLVDMSISELNSLAGLDDRAKILMGARESSETPSQAAH